MNFRNTQLKITRINIGTMTATQQLTRTFAAMVYAAATLVLLCWSHCVNAQEVRTWVDSSGKFKIEATYEKLEGENVFLKLPDGEVKQIPFSMLSVGDQERIREIDAPIKPAETESIDPPPTVSGDEAMPSGLAAGTREVRTWVDSSGQFKIKASFEKRDGDSVLLKLPDGQIKQIPFSMLSVGDQERIRAINAPGTPAKIPATTMAIAPDPITPEPITPEPVAAQPDSTEPVAPPPATVAVAETTEANELTAADLEPPKPIVHISRNIGDLDVTTIQPPDKAVSQRVNPKYLFSVSESNVAALPPEIQRAALLLLNEPNQPREAVRALEFFKLKWPSNRLPTLIKLLINCASSDHKYNREAALEILSNRDPDQSFPYIFARVDDTSFTIRSMAYQMLRQIGDRRAIEPLAKRFATDDVDRISSLLRSFGSTSEGPVIPYLSHQDPDIRLRACNLIGKIGTEKSLPALQEMAQREQTMVLKAQTRSSINKIKRRIANGNQ